MHIRPFWYLILLLIITCFGCSSSTGSSGKSIPSPTGLELKYTGNGVVSLTWDVNVNGDAFGYNVYWTPGDDLDPLSHPDSLYTTSTSIAISGLPDDVLYSFGITSVDNHGNESELVKVSGKPFSKPAPLAPTGLVAVADNIDDPRITLTWNDSNEQYLAYYTIYRATSADDAAFSYSLLNTATANGYIDTDVEIGVQYYYRITAVEIGGWESASSSLESDYSLPSVQLISPDNFAYVSPSPTLLWQTVSGAMKYKVVLRSSRIGSEIWSTMVETPASSVDYTGNVVLDPGSAYYWEVGAISKSEINSVSKVATFIVQSE